MLLLKAIEDNWGLIILGDWVKTEWKIEDDGRYSMTTSYHPTKSDVLDIVFEGVMSSSDLNKLKATLDEPWPTEKLMFCDGIAFEFEMYQDEKVVKHRDLGYIYGIEVYERIKELLPRRKERIKTVRPDQRELCAALPRREETLKK